MADDQTLLQSDRLPTPDATRERAHPSSGRLLYLDNLRSFAMLFGVFVHTATLGNYGLLELIPLVSHHFRMGTFFAVSGFFAVLLILRRGTTAFLIHRTRSLAVPFVTGVILLNPVTLWLVYRYHNGTVPFSELPQIIMISFDPNAQAEVGGAIVWHLHLWFLASLLAYMLVMPAVMPVLRRLQVPVRNTLAQLPASLVPLACALAVAIAVVAMRVVIRLVLQPLGAPWIVQATFGYWPYFLLGALMHVEPRIWDQLHRVSLPLIGTAAILILLVMKVPDGLIASILGNVSRSLNICASLFALLWLFRRFVDSGSPVLRLLADATYTIYIFHYLIIYLLGTMLAPLLAHDGPAFFAIISVATFAIGLALHVGLISRRPWLLFLFNGKPLRPPPIAMAAASRTETGQPVPPQ